MGILVGDQGIGKTLLLAEFRKQQQRSDRFPVLIDLEGLDGDEFLWQLASQLRVNPTLSDSTFVRWRQIADRLQEHRYDQIHTIALLDNLDQAGESARPFILRLLNARPGEANPVTTIASCNPHRLASLGSELLGRAELRIELPTWTIDDTSSFLQTSVRDAGRNSGIFEEAAASRLHELAAGVPRFVCQLAELALLAGAGQQAQLVDAATIEAVFEELCIGQCELTATA